MAITRAARLIYILLLGLVLALLAPTSPASAVAPGPPLGLSPAVGDVTAGAPQLSWTRLRDATKYDVQVSRTADFAAPVWKRTTVNTNSVPTSALPSGALWWRVRGVKGSEVGDWTTVQFSRRQVAAPAQVTPADADRLAQPAESLTYSWTPVAGATGYQVDVGTDPEFVDPSLITSYTSTGTAMNLSNLPRVGHYYWRVRAALGAGFTSDWSGVRSYDVVGLSPVTLLSPPDDNFNVDNLVPPVGDVDLDWAPVKGAANYHLQISDDRNFLTITHEKSGITGSRYSPPTTLRSNQYYWRVRPVDASGNAPEWPTAAVQGFDLKWLQDAPPPETESGGRDLAQPVPLYPTDGITVGNPLYYQWSPLARASTYTLQLSTNPTFGSGVQSCSTIHTTFTPVTTQCQPTSVGTWYWRVIGTDAPSSQTTDSIGALRGSFDYRPSTPSVLAPGPSATVSEPTMRWLPMPGAIRYRVTLTNAETGAAVGTKDTYSTALTWQSALTIGTTYRWQVQTISQAGLVGTATPADDQRRFTLSAVSDAGNEPVVLSPVGAETHDFPTLRWRSVVGATSYRLWIRKPTAQTFTRLGTAYPYAAGEDVGTDYLATGSYEWYAEAFNGNTSLGTSTTRGSFTIVGNDRITGYTVALSGLNTTGHPNDASPQIDRVVCTAELPANCQNLRQSPVLSWTASPEADYYKLYVARDKELTNAVSGFPITTNNTMWMQTKAFVDAQAGSAYFWEVVPCNSVGCEAPQHATHQFNKETVGPALTTPGLGSDVGDDVRLEWRTWLASQRRDDANTTLDGSRAEVSARTYTVQTSLTPTFTTTLESIDVDQPWLTSFATTYPEGPIFWRVRANDHGEIGSNWSEVGEFVKRSPVPQLLAPAEGARRGGDEPLSWEPLDFAASYVVEVYKAGDTDFNVANRVVNATVKQPVYAPTNLLAAADTAYVWRVRRADAKGRLGDWSEPRTFFVTKPAPTLLNPASSATVAPLDSLFTWVVEPRAKSYKWEIRKADGSGSTSVETSAPGWAPESSIGGGEWQWRVTAIDAGDKDLGTTEWRPFSVMAAPETTHAVSLLGNAQVGTTITASRPTWSPDPADADVTYQWFRGTATKVGTPIEGATATVYEVVPADVGQSLRVVATGYVPGYPLATSTSEPRVGGEGAPLSPTTPPTIGGAPRMGSTLTGSSGTWPGSPTFTYQWYRGTRPINGATSRNYRVSAADAAQTLSFAVTASAPGRADGFAVTRSGTVPKLTSQTRLTLSPGVVKRGKRAVAVIAVGASGLAATGRVTVFDGTKRLAAMTLQGGKSRYRLPVLKVGAHVIRVAYAGSPSINPSTAVGRLKVKR